MSVIVFYSLTTCFLWLCQNVYFFQPKALIDKWGAIKSTCRETFYSSSKKKKNESLKLKVTSLKKLCIGSSKPVLRLLLCYVVFLLYLTVQDDLSVEGELSGSRDSLTDKPSKVRTATVLLSQNMRWISKKKKADFCCWRCIVCPCACWDSVWVPWLPHTSEEPPKTLFELVSCPATFAQRMLSLW